MSPDPDRPAPGDAPGSVSTAVLRPARPDEAPAVARVLVASRQAFLPYAPSPHAPAAVRQWVEQHLLPTGGVTVAEVAGVIVGVLAISRSPRVSWIDQLYLLPGHTGGGLGSALLQRAHAELAPPIRLYTFQANVGARRFYERHGYVAVAFTDGASNEEQCPDVLYERSGATLID